MFPLFFWPEVYKSPFSALSEMLTPLSTPESIRIFIFGEAKEKNCYPARSRNHVGRKILENIQPEETKSCSPKYEYRLTHSLPMHPFSTA